MSSDFDHGGQILDVVHREPVDLLADPHRIGVEQGRDPEPAAGEPGIAGQGVTEITDTDQGHRAALGQPQHVLDLLDQELDVVAHAARAVGPEVRKILAELRGIHAGGPSQALAGHRVVVSVGEGVQGAQVFGQARNGGLGQIGKVRAARRVPLLAHEAPCCCADNPECCDAAGTNLLVGRRLRASYLDPSEPPAPLRSVLIGLAAVTEYALVKACTNRDLGHATSRREVVMPATFSPGPAAQLCGDYCSTRTNLTTCSISARRSLMRISARANQRT